MMRRVVHYLIRRFPPDFRHSYGTDMLATFDDRWRERRGVRDAARILIDLGHSAWLERRRLSRGHRPMKGISQDVRYALRTLRKSPGFAAVVIVTLALGIGANTAMFSIANAVLWSSLPYPHPERLVAVAEVQPGNPDMTWGATFPTFRDWQTQAMSLEHMAVTMNANRVLRDGTPARLRGAVVTPEFFPLLGVPPKLGRAITSADDRTAPDVIVLSHETWTNRFGADPAIVGRSIRFDGFTPTVIGVMPAKFNYPPEAAYWLPLAQALPPAMTTRRDGWGYAAIARMKPGRSERDVLSEVSGITAAVQRAYPESRRGLNMRVRLLRDDLGSDLQPALLVLLGGVCLVLLIACGNVASLMLVRAMARARELMIRTALGACRARLIRQLLTEAALLAMCGGIAGVGLAMLATRSLRQLSSDWRLADVPIDTRVLVFAFAATVVTCLLFAVLPAIRATRVERTDALRSGSRSSQSRQRRAAQQALVTAEVAVCMVLLVAAGLLLQSWWRLLAVDPGFRPDALATLRVNVPPAYKEDGQIRAFYSRAADQLAAIPGVAGVTLTSALPISGGEFGGDLTIEGRPSTIGELGTVSVRRTTPEYFRVMGIPLVRGREFDGHDDTTRDPVVTISESMARRFWPNQDPLGQRLKIGSRDLSTWYTIVGVARDVHNASLAADIGYSAYTPFTQAPFPQGPFRGTMDLAVRARGNPQTLLPALTAELRRIEPALLLERSETMQERIDESVAPRRLNLTLLGSFASLALSLSAIGIYGVVAFAVRQRTQEFGIRMALGARPGNVMRLVLQQGFKLAVAGALIGIPGAIVASRLLTSLLFETRATDPAIFVSVGLLVTVVAMGASWIPAWRATQVAPTEALRAD
jgi:putative ABC transport system permease protein